MASDFNITYSSIFLGVLGQIPNMVLLTDSEVLTVVIVVVYTLFFGNFGHTSETSLGKTGNSETSGKIPP